MNEYSGINSAKAACVPPTLVGRCDDGRSKRGQYDNADNAELAAPFASSLNVMKAVQ